MLFRSNQNYKGISSILLLTKVLKLISSLGYKIENIDSTIIAEKPKMAPYIFKMRSNISEALNIDISMINIKATTEEGLGFTGRGEGISAQSICLLNK